MESASLQSFMSKDVLSVSADTPLNKIATLMRDHKYSCLPVIEDSKPVGIITERDLVAQLDNLLQDRDSEPLIAADFMSPKLITLNQEQSLFEALVLCQANKIRHLPVIDNDGNLCGMVTYTDIANLHRSLMESQHVSIDENIAQRLQKLEAANKKLRELSLEDPLLGIGNRRAMEVDLQSTHSLSQRYNDCYAVAMIDIDNFKYFNDYYGHQAGDKALQDVTNSIKGTIRSSDRLYRYGGEELLVLFPQTGMSGAAETAERILRNLGAKKIPNCQSPFRYVTVSCGVSVYADTAADGEKSWSEVIEQADQALYKAKEGGRNQVVLSQTDHPRSVEQDSTSANQRREAH